MYETHSNVPIPKRRRVAGVKRIYPFDTMAIGAFFFVPGKTIQQMAPHACVMGRKLRRKFETRSTTMMEQIGGWLEVPADHPHAVWGIGIWRVK